MISVRTHLKTSAGMMLALFVLFAAQSAFAVGTLSNTQIDNRAQVDYDVGGIGQEPIESSPGGNSTPGVGNGGDTSFVVDNMVDLTVVEVGGAPTSVNPGQGDAVTTFTITNTGNTAQDYALAAANLAGDDFELNNLRVLADGNANGTYEAGTDTATFVDSLAADATTTVFVLADVPIGAANAEQGDIELTATTADAGSGGLTITTETAGPDTAGVDVVLADTGRDGLETAQDGYLVSSAQLQITKTSAVIRDPFNGTTDPKAIPGAVMEYVIEVNNTGAVAADSVRITDVIDTANLTVTLGEYNGGLSDVQIDVGTAPSDFCTADAADADADGCGLAGSTLEVDRAVTVGTVAADNPAFVRFRVTIN